MKKIYPVFTMVLAFVLNIVSQALFAQDLQPCGTDIYHKHKLKTDPTYAQRVAHSEKLAQKWMAENTNFRKKREEGRVVIPVVFHVVYNVDQEAVQKISKERILEQVEILNRDFNRLNQNRNETRSIFDSIAGNTEIIFQLATVDPEGEPTDGITYTETDVVGFDILPFLPGYEDLDSLKSTSGGGRDAWVGDYLNIWVGSLTFLTTEGLLGIATFPQSADPDEIAGTPITPDELQGVSLLFRTVGTSFDQAGDTLYHGRTLTHEIGHFLGLRHIWGDDTDDPCLSSDFVDDTPQAQSEDGNACNFESNECANESAFWGNIDPPNNIENYMDYSGDLCYNMFTMGQSVRMQGFTFADSGRVKLWDGSAVGGRDLDQFKSWAYTESTNCPESCDGKILLQSEKAEGEVLYFVDGEASNSDIVENLCSGIHQVLAIDNATNDSIAYEVYISPGRLIDPIVENETVDATCGTCPDGSATITITSGKAPFNVVWNTTPETTGLSISNQLPGTYTYTITDACGQEFQDDVEVSFATSIADLSPQEMMVYPNPSKNILNVTFATEQNISGYQIIHMTGKIVQEKAVQSEQNRLTVDAKSLQSGPYILRLIAADGSIKNLAFVKE